MTDKNKTYIWSLFTRLFHWLLVLLITLSYLTSLDAGYLKLHVAFSVSVMVLIVFRIIMLFLDVKYSKLRDFNFKFADLKSYISHLKAPVKSYLGHNPAASYVIIGILLFTLLTALSGLLLYGIEEGRGVLAFLNAQHFQKMYFIHEIHELLAYSLLLFIFVHISGVIVDFVLHEKSALPSMIKGYKPLQGEDLELKPAMKLYGKVWIVLPLLLLFYILLMPDNIFHYDSNKEVNYGKLHSDFKEECSACHTLYPPFLYPKKSIENMMSSLGDHFGEDASLDESTTRSIRQFLLDRSAESSTKESALRMFRSLQESGSYHFSESTFWKKAHHDLNDRDFKRKKVRSKSNCSACHRDIEKGKIENENIYIPPER